MDKNKMFQRLFGAYVAAYPTKSRKTCQDEVVQKWNDIKNDIDLQQKVDNWLQELKATCITRKGSLLWYWCKQTSADKNHSQNVQVEIAEQNVSQSDGQVADDKSDDSTPSTSNSAGNRVAAAQLYLQSQIDILNCDLVGLYEQQKRGMLTPEQEVDLEGKRNKKIELEKELQRKKTDQIRAKKAREDRKRKLDALFEDNPELRIALNTRGKMGRPRTEKS